MAITDIFIKRPVLATVVSLLIFIFGLRALVDLQVRQYPKMETAIVSVTTAYAGANAELVQGFITDPVQRAVASADGIDYLTSSTSAGVSSVQAHIKLNFDPQAAFTNIMSKVAEIRGQLPREAEQPVVQKQSDQGAALMYLSFESVKMTPQQITDYVNRVVIPKIQTLPGVSKADLFGGKTFSMRIWINPNKLAAFKLTPSDIQNALLSNNFQTTAGATKGEYVAINIRADTDLNDVQQFKNIIVSERDNAMVRLGDVARVELGSETYDSNVTFNGKKAVFIAINATPTANPLTVIKTVRETLPSIGKDLPPSLSYTIAYDATKYIQASIDEVLHTIIEATLIVVVVIFLFLGSLRSVLIPVVTIPLSLIGVCSFMLALGYSINLLTLLAMVLAIGLVVDDAIVVVENIHRYMETGLSAYEAALKGAREIAMPVISMTITLAAVYAPIGFMGGLTGALFKEFAFTLASAVIISGIIALSLSPMMCSKLLSADESSNRFIHFLDKVFARLKQFYQRRLHNVLNFRPVVLVFAAVILSSLFFLYSATPKETAPTEDVGFFMIFGQAPQYATIDYTHTFAQDYQRILQKSADVEDYFVIEGMNGVNSIFGGLIMKPWNQRSTKVDQYKGQLQNEVNGIAGFQSFAAIPPALPGGGDGTPVKFVVTSTNDYRLISPLVNKMVDDANKSGLFLFTMNTLKFNQPQTTIHINRDKAAQLGLSMRDIGSALSSSLSGGYINRFNLAGRSYKVIPQLEREYRLTPEQLAKIYVRTTNSTMVPLSTVVTLSQHAVPNHLNQFQQLNSATIQAVMRPGVSLGTALNFLEQKATELFPKGTSYDFAGQSRQYIQESSSLLYAFFFSIIIIYLVLSAQFESFRDPLIILVSVPMSICGALIPLNLGAATINIYTQVGLITLIGLISKHGILMVDFANHLQQQGMTVREAIEEAASVRLRPILMTTAAMIFGVMPLVLAKGAGAVSRFDIGLVISSGMAIGTLFTLFVVPTIYTYLARDHRQLTGALTEESA